MDIMTLEMAVFRQNLSVSIKTVSCNVTMPIWQKENQLIKVKWYTCIKIPKNKFENWEENH